ncbi:Biotin carboxyl carrier protein [Dethiosulfatibacter aminovorans DSM 17477]|uniref:Biotin carboxyl carrier protein n=1 Tax=Dethiosulfatibacter aminovorans DSM 17477 TaxID=1121476 RepID=A0A1M6KVV6_9FIRM|nr:biotin/lipoyl-containing protein [Dethiosulfatibacter aminovorans]SHJ63023.1 Biotin carboxyl carrier protein [Dethiosulfatibacter aminovorans DSM 17477]
MKQYNITVNGKTYEVAVEEIGGAPSAPVFSAPAAAPRAAAPAPAPAAPKAAPAAAPAGGGELIAAPMPGTILDIKVTEGQAVKAGDILLILEAMKMENEIVAPADGTVKSIHTSKGTSVSSGDALITLG